LPVDIAVDCPSGNFLRQFFSHFLGAHTTLIFSHRLSDEKKGEFGNKSSRAGRKPSSVPEKSGDDHSSRTAVACGLQQPTREPRAGRPQTLPYLALLRVGFTKLPVSPPKLVSSYLAISPLPQQKILLWRFIFCGTFLKVALTGCYPAPCPAELGLSSRQPVVDRRSSSLL
jgi:hypothetical protein